MATGSYEEIDYSLRPAKHIERRMIGEALKRLVYFEPSSSYRYVGFGSTTFTDFDLFHRSLAIENMVSIEKDVERAKRFQFNIPFGCVELRLGHSNEILPGIGWEQKTILWLDYDFKLSKAVLADLETFSSSAPSGSVLLCTLNVHYDASEPNLIETFKSDLEQDLPLDDLTVSDFQSWNSAALCSRIMTTEIQKYLRVRNGGLPPEERLTYQQLFNFKYQDGARMMTVGGILCSAEQSEFEKCAFDQVPFLRTFGQEPLHIKVPVLTRRERRFIDSRLPSGTSKELSKESGVREKDINQYRKVYRYFPNYAETESL